MLRRARPLIHPRGVRVGTLACVVGALLGGCNFQIAAPSYIDTTKLISVRAEVSELGPLNPGRAGSSSSTPMAEVMPGDRLAFEAVVVDGSGQPLDPDEVESLWFQCGNANCYGFGLNPNDHRFEQPCEDLGDQPSLDAVCRLGEGSGRVDFEVNAIGPDLVQSRVATYYGVIAWNGRSAQECWEQRKANELEVRDCAYVHRPVKVGPSWWMLAYADTIGLDSPFPIEQFPAPIYGQLANRVPAPRFEVFVDEQSRGVYPEQSQFSAPLGASIRLELDYVDAEQLLQSYFAAQEVGESGDFWFTAVPEVITDTVFTTDLIHTVGDRNFPGAPVELVVDEYAEARPSRVLVVYQDDRYGEGVAQLDFEIEG